MYSYIIVYVEPKGLVFIARKEKILTEKGNIIAAIDAKGEFRTHDTNSKSFTPYKDRWEELFE